MKKEFNYKKTNNGIVLTRYLGWDENVIIPEEIDGIEVTSLGDFCFRGQDIKSVIGKSIKRINNEAFKYTQKLQMVDFPKLEYIGDEAFAESSLQELTLSSTIKTISKKAFFRSNINNFNCEDNKIYSVHDDCLYMLDTLIYCPRFRKKIDATFAKAIGAYAFYNSKIENITMPNVKVIGEYAFARSKFANGILPPQLVTIGIGAFSECFNIINLLIPSSVEEIAKEAFYYCRNLKTIVIGENIKTIPIRCFASCWSLKSANLNYVEWLRTESFTDCPHFDDCDFSKIIRIDSKALYDTAFEELNLPRCTIIKSQACGLMRKLKKVTLSSDLYEVRRGTFAFCRGLEDIQAGVETYFQEPEEYNNIVKNNFNEQMTLFA